MRERERERERESEINWNRKQDEQTVTDAKASVIGGTEAQIEASICCQNQGGRAERSGGEARLKLTTFHFYTDSCDYVIKNFLTSNLFR